MEQTGLSFYQTPPLLSLQARFLLSKVNPSQTHNNLYAWGQVSNGRAAHVWECCKIHIDMFVCAVAILSHQVATNSITFVFGSFLLLLIRWAALDDQNGVFKPGCHAFSVFWKKQLAWIQRDLI